MTFAYHHEPRFPRAWTWKIAAAAAVVLLLAAAAFAFATFRGSPAAAEPSAPSLSVATVSGATGVPIEVPLRLANAPGLAAATATLAYDPAVVALAAVRAGDVPQGALTWHHDAAAGSLVLLLTTSLAHGATGDHAFAIVTLVAREGAVGAVSPLTLAIRQASGPGGEAVALEAAGGAFRNGVPGDVLGDGTVDRADYDRLAAHLVGEAVPIVALNADLDGDGAVTDADALRLHQYLDGARAAP